MAPDLGVGAVLGALLEHDVGLRRQRRKAQRILECPANLLRLSRRDPLGKGRVVAASEDHATAAVDDHEAVVAGQPRLDGGRRVVRPRQRLDDETVEAVGLDAGTAGFVEIEPPRARLRLRAGERREENCTQKDEGPDRFAHGYLYSHGGSASHSSQPRRNPPTTFMFKASLVIAAVVLCVACSKAPNQHTEGAPLRQPREPPSRDHDRVARGAALLRPGPDAVLRLQPRGVDSLVPAGRRDRSRLRDVLLGRRVSRSGRTSTRRSRRRRRRRHSTRSDRRVSARRRRPRRSRPTSRRWRSATSPIRRPTVRRSTPRTRQRCATWWRSSRTTSTRRRCSRSR